MAKRGCQEITFAILFVLCSSSVVAQTHAIQARYGRSPENAKMLLPDRKTTPGLAVPMSTKKVCGTKWGKDERHVTESMKKQVCAAYGQTGCPNRTNFEIDHLVSRELGGADDLPNLWPQPAPQFHMKDVLENHLHRQVCSGKMTLSEAQREISTDWYAAYLKMQKEAAGN